MYTLTIDGYPITITNSEKVLWPEVGIRKIDYISKMVELAPYILPYVKDRLLTTIRYPDGVNGKSFYQKEIPEHAPEWICTEKINGINYILLNSIQTLVWLSTQACLEFHTSFNYCYEKDNPTFLVFDLDPSSGQTFESVREAALIIYEVLKSLDIKSYIKTSGATGMQIFIPVGGKYNYMQARNINNFFAKYLAQKYPAIITIERFVNKRQGKLYFDYLQMWYSKTIISAYSPRSTPFATVSMPIEWSEVNSVKPECFTLLNVIDRLKQKGDLFKGLFDQGPQNLDFILERIT